MLKKMLRYLLAIYRIKDNRVNVLQVLGGNISFYGKNNVIKGRFSSILSGNRAIVYGKKNKIIVACDNNLKLSNIEIIVKGDNNIVEIDDVRVIRKTKIIINGAECKINIGSNTGIGGARIICEGNNKSICIGANCMLSDNIEIWASDGHKIYDQDDSIINEPGNIHIEDGVWIGAHTKILKNVRIKFGAIIGMNSLVTKDIESKSLNVGAPTKQIKEGVTWVM